MRGYIKRERPTIQTAHNFHQVGSFYTGLEHRLSLEDREIELGKVNEELSQSVKSQFPRTQNLEYAILKAHLIIEHAISQYIRCSVRTFVDVEKIKFTFSQKLEIAYLLGFGVNSPIIIPTIERINKVRNQVAHSFNLDRVAVDELLRINSEDYASFSAKNDRERIRGLRMISAFVCGIIAGELLAAHVILTEGR